ncbi:MAG: (2Fe-2S)-binding protein, partial [Candidatus Izemoplasmatales bacterium]
HEYGHIVCRCELVTLAEIKNAIHRPVGATTLDGVKRRTRAGAGRCQGGFCAPKVLEILSEELGKDPRDIAKNSKQSTFLVGLDKEI